MHPEDYILLVVLVSIVGIIVFMVVMAYSVAFGLSIWSGWKRKKRDQGTMIQRSQGRFYEHRQTMRGNEAKEEKA